MINLPNALDNFMKGKDLAGLKPFAFLYRNKWDSVNNTYALDTTPIDISALIVKPNTLSMTLDVNEIAQYNANNVTLTLSDTENRFVEGTPNSYFPDGYQLYGSRVVLYYGLDSTNRTALFTGVIKDLPTYKPEKYQVDLKLVSPLELLKDIEAKEFSNKVTGENLTFVETDSDGHKIYQTTGTGVGGFNAVYADGGRLFEGVDYEVSQINALGLSALITIINSNYYYSTISADYYTWKTGLTVEQIVAGLVGLAGYDSGTEDIRNVAWNTGVRTRKSINGICSIGYYKSGNDFVAQKNTFTVQGGFSGSLRGAYLVDNFEISFKLYQFNKFALADEITDPSVLVDVFLGISYIKNGFMFGWTGSGAYVYWCSNFNTTYQQFDDIGLINDVNSIVTIKKQGNTVSITVNQNGQTQTISYSQSITYNAEATHYNSNNPAAYYSGYTITKYANDNTTVLGVLEDYTSQILFEILNLNSQTTLDCFGATLSNAGQYDLLYRYGDTSTTLSQWTSASIGESIGVTGQYFQFLLKVNSTDMDVADIYADFLSSSLSLQLVNLSGLTVLEALQDFALISGYEFGVDRQGVFFFKPRVASTTPTYVLDHDEVVKVDTVKKNLSDFFTKLTLTFAQVPLEFYANTGERPTLVDKYGIINKEIDKPDIVNYDNPELAQAIGPQLLEVYSSMPNIIQAVGKLNLALELGDIVSLRRNFNLVEPNSATDYAKYITQQTYYRACKITGMNYNFSKKQITYTLRDVSNSNTEPTAETVGHYIYELPIELGV